MLALSFAFVSASRGFWFPVKLRAANEPIANRRPSPYAVARIGCRSPAAFCRAHRRRRKRERRQRQSAQRSIDSGLASSRRRCQPPGTRDRPGRRRPAIPTRHVSAHARSGRTRSTSARPARPAKPAVSPVPVQRNTLLASGRPKPNTTPFSLGREPMDFTSPAQRPIVVWSASRATRTWSIARSM